MIDKTDGKLCQIIDFAKSNGLWYGRRGLRSKLMYLITYANRRGCIYDRHVSGQGTVCTFYRDFAHNSLAFVVDFIRNGVKEKSPMCGGLIYSGPDVPLDGTGPALTVSLSRDSGTGWSIHT